LTPANDWQVVEVWENFLGQPCEADRAEKFGVSVPGVRESQWLENFKWGDGPLATARPVEVWALRPTKSSEPAQLLAMFPVGILGSEESQRLAELFATLLPDAGYIQARVENKP